MPRKLKFRQIFAISTSILIFLRRKMSSANKTIYYSEKYYDDEFEYRHVHLPKEIAKLVPKNKLMTESEWRNIGIQQSEGWIHYMTHNPEKHVILFRRPRQDKPEKLK